LRLSLTVTEQSNASRARPVLSNHHILMAVMPASLSGISHILTLA